MAKEPTELAAALKGVLGGLLEHAEAERGKSEPYNMLFGSFKDGGVARAVMDAKDQMMTIAMDLSQLLEREAGVQVDNDVFATIMALPLAHYLAEQNVRENEGGACCVDKATLLLRTFLYERLELKVEATPFDRNRLKTPGGPE